MIQVIPSTDNFYGADKDGTVYRLAGVRKPRPLKPQKHPNGYCFLSISVNSKMSRKSVHRLVAEAFHGPIPEGHDVCHANHIRHDNRAENLSFGTRSENCKQSAAAGNYGHWRKGVKPASTKLADHQRTEILYRYAAGAFQSDIAAEYGITQALVSRVVRTWKPCLK